MGNDMHHAFETLDMTNYSSSNHLYEQLDPLKIIGGIMYEKVEEQDPPRYLYVAKYLDISGANPDLLR